MKMRTNASTAARIQTEANRVFGSTEKASIWLSRPNGRLSGQSPLQVIDNECGATLVEQILAQIDHGIYC
jgi:putative toxin-antitoxin system antitoxin component (TIGR02293 family)